MATPDEPCLRRVLAGDQRRRLRVMHDDDVPLVAEHGRAVAVVPEIGGDLIGAKLERLALHRVVDPLGHGEELVVGTDHAPLGVDSDVAHQRDLRREQLGDPASVGGRVQLQDAGAVERATKSDDLVEQRVGGDLAVVGEAAA